MSNIVRPENLDWRFQLANDGAFEDILMPGAVRADVARMARDADGNIVGLKGDGGPLSASWYAPRAHTGFALAQPPVSGITTAVGASCAIDSSAAATVDGETVWQITATASAASNNWFEAQIPLQSQSFAASDLTVELMVDDMSKIHAAGGGITAYLGTASYSKFALYSINSQLIPSTTSSQGFNGAFTSYQIHEALWTKSGFSDATGNQAWVNCKLRVFVTNGQTITFTLRAIRVGAYRRKARLAIVADDGYLSWWTMGVPVMREFGFVSSMAVIYDEIGNSAKVTLAQAREYVAEGNECIPHGPNDGSGGTGNLFTAWTTNAQRIADATACRDYLLSNGLCTQWGARSYIWPQGRFCESTSDLSLLPLMQGEEFNVARGVTVPTIFYMHKTQGISSVNKMPLNLPIIGHTFTNAGAEAANIAAIIVKIGAVAAAGGDCSLMLHRVVGVDAASLATDISINRLRELCTAIKAEVDAGRMDVVLFSEFAK